jgi:hypothetical protein
MELYAARGEAESFQVVVRVPTGGLTNVKVSASDLTGPGGSVITARNLSLFREHYVYVSSPTPDWIYFTNHPSGAPGWFPDGLIPSIDPDTGAPPSATATLKAFPFALDAGKNQPVWIDVNVPRGTAAGRYTGTVNVTADQGSANVSMDITVWGFELPLQPNLKSAFGCAGAPTVAQNKELLRNRIMPCGLVDPTLERTFIDTLGLNAVQTGPFFSEGCSTNWIPTVDEFRSIADSHETDLLRYDYSADEIWRCSIGTLAPIVIQWAQNLHLAGRGLKNLIVTPPVPELYDDGLGTGQSAVDIWAIPPELYLGDGVADRVNYVLSKGDMVWSVPGFNWDLYSPKWGIDFDPLNHRIGAGFISQSLGFTGLLRWRVDYWSSTPWDNVEPDGGWPGEAILLYPGTEAGIQGVAPSMRLKWVRDGVDDYDYIQILKGLGHEDLFLRLAQTVGQSYKVWTQDPVALENARRTIGQKIHTILSTPPQDTQPPTATATPTATSTPLPIDRIPAPAPDSVSVSGGSAFGCGSIDGNRGDLLWLGLLSAALFLRRSRPGSRKDS